MQLLAWRNESNIAKQILLLASGVAILLIFSILFPTTANAEDKSKQLSYVIVDKAELYAEADGRGQVLLELPRGEEVVVENWVESGYSEVSCGSLRGFIHSDKLKTPIQVKSFSPPVTGMVNADGVNLRAKGEKEATIISTLKKNVQVEVLSIAGDWYCVNAESQTGYVFKDYIDLHVEEGDDTPLVEDGYRALKMGVSGREVARLQQALKDAGYFEGEINGRYGARTRDAVSAYQSAQGLNNDGIADASVQKMLYA